MKKFIIILCLLYACNAYAVPPSGDTFKVKSDATDTDPDFLDAKLSGGVGGDILLEDGFSLIWGTDSDFWSLLDPVGTEFEIWTDDSDGIGTDKNIIRIDSGTDTTDFYGDITVLKNQNAPTGMSISNTTDGTGSVAQNLYASSSANLAIGAASDSFTTAPTLQGYSFVTAIGAPNGLILYNIGPGNTCFSQGTDLAAGDFYDFRTDANIDLTDTDGEQSFCVLNVPVDQSGTGAYNGLEILATEDNTGDGTSGDGNNLIKAGTAVVDNLFMVRNNGNIISTGVNGIDINPGSDVDVDLISVGVTGSPRFSWDESEGAFSQTNANINTVNAGNSIIKMFSDSNNNQSDAEAKISLYTDGAGIGSATIKGTIGWDETTDLVFMGYGAGGAGSGGDLNIDSSGQVGIGTETPNATLTVNGSQSGKRTDGGAADYNPSILTTDYIITVNNSAAARAVTISTEDVQAGTAGNPRFFVIMDEEGAAGTYAITITLENGGTINGAASNIIAGDYDSRVLYSTGTNAFVF